MKNIIKSIVVCSMIAICATLEAATVNPLYCNHNKIIGNTQIMTNTETWVAGQLSSFLVGCEYDTSTEAGIKAFCDSLIAKMGGTVKKPNGVYLELVDIVPFDVVSIGNTYSKSGVTVDWGDGNKDTTLTAVVPTHQYTASGNYSVKILGDIYQIDGYSDSNTNGEYVVATNDLDKKIVDDYDFTALTNGIKFGDKLFLNSNIKDIVIPYNVTNLGVSCFAWCTNLETVVFETNLYLQTISDGCFYGDKNLTTLILPTNNLQHIGQIAFAECTSLNSLTIPSTVDYFGQDCFRHCGFETLNIYCSLNPDPRWWRSDKYLIHSCPNLDTVNFYSPCTNVCQGAIYDCNSLKYISVDTSIVSMAKGAIAIAESLTNIVFESGSNLKYLGLNFDLCSDLKNLTLPDGLEYFGGLGADSGVTNVYIPNTVKYLGALQLANKIYYTDFTLPTSLEVLNKTFSNWEGLKEIVLPDTVREIGDSAFSWCSSMTNIVFNNGCLNLRQIGESSFQGVALTDVEVPINVTNIDYAAFGSCSSLKRIVFGENLKTIGGYVVNGSNAALTNITCKATTPPTATSSSLFGNKLNDNCYIYVPSGSVSDYKAKSGWSSYAAKIVPIP